ncbi:MAG: hypothetical protein NTW05_25860 [Pseudonocardiales bacterium]|nr:hypothetical protein [Pseudonocardiales bacterium]
MLVWVTLFAGLVVLAAGSVAVTRVDRRWRPRHQRCCRCQDAWFGEGKLCDRCGARGRDDDRFGERYRAFPTHGWQGYLDTGPIPVVDLPVPRRPVEAAEQERGRPAGDHSSPLRRS